MQIDIYKIRAGDVVCKDHFPSLKKKKKKAVD